MAPANGKVSEFIVFEFLDKPCKPGSKFTDSPTLENPVDR
jgi:hypothetical protein